MLLAVAWAVYLIPKALKHHDEVARTRSIDRFSTALRVLARREPVNRSDSRLVVTPARATREATAAPAPSPEPAARVAAASSQVHVAVTPAVSRARLAARRKAARLAARRRRRILTLLLLVGVAVGVTAYLGRLPWWSLAVPGGLTLAFLVLCRVLVRRESHRDASVLTRPATSVDTALVPAEETVEEVVIVVDDHRVAELENEDTVAIPAALLQAAVLPTADGGTLWDPLPVTLPTYVTKPKARRTVRTIDLGDPGVWTSGRTDEDTRLASKAAGDESGKGDTDEGRQRAVGS